MCTTSSLCPCDLSHDAFGVTSPPWVEQTDVCENITFTRFATRVVIRYEKSLDKKNHVCFTLRFPVEAENMPNIEMSWSADTDQSATR